MERGESETGREKDDTKREIGGGELREEKRQKDERERAKREMGRGERRERERVVAWLLATQPTGL